MAENNDGGVLQEICEGKPRRMLDLARTCIEVLEKIYREDEGMLRRRRRVDLLVGNDDTNVMR